MQNYADATSCAFDRKKIYMYREIYIMHANTSLGPAVQSIVLLTISLVKDLLNLPVHKITVANTFCCKKEEAFALVKLLSRTCYVHTV